MKVWKVATLALAFLLLMAPLFILNTAWAQVNPVYYSVEPVAVAPLTDTNSSAYGLETPATPSPANQYFHVDIHLRNATLDNIPVGVAGIEAHLNFTDILTYAQPVNFTDMTGATGGVLTGPKSKILYAIAAGFYDNNENPITDAPYTGATQYEVAAASTATAWNATDGLVAVIYFQITGQPSSQPNFFAPMNIIAADLRDKAAKVVPFDIIQGTLTIDAPGQAAQYTLTVNVVGNGTVTKNPSNATYASGTVVTLNATPSAGWAFQGWSGDLTGQTNPANITMNSNKTVTATFIQALPGNYTLTVNIVGQGNVMENPTAPTYPSGTIVTLTATPNTGWTFQTWSGDITGQQNPTNITINTNETVTATFTQVANPVYYSVEPVAVAPLTDTNSSAYGLETPATPSPVNQYFYVEIHLRNATSTNIPAGLAGAEVHFNFSSILTYAQVVNFTNTLGTTTGVLTGQSSLIYAVPAGFYDNNGSLLHAPYTGATQYQVAAASTAGGWNGVNGLVVVIYFQITGQPSYQQGQTDFTAPLNIAFADLTDEQVIEVPFSLIQGTLHIDASQPPAQYSLTVNIVGNGTVTKNPFNTTYTSGTAVTLTATPSAGWTFQTWSGDITGQQNPTNITMDGNKTVTATFTQQAQNYTLTANVIGSGTVTKSPSSATYLSGTIVTLTAVPSTGWTFQTWSGDITGPTNPATITMNSNKTITATFIQALPGNYTLTVNIVGNGTISKSPATSTYPSGTIVTLTATPNTGWTFQTWSGDITGLQNPTNITMNSNKNVTATFTQLEHDIAITAVNISPTTLSAGQNVHVEVEAANLGDYSETFNVTVYYNSNLIQVISVSLNPHSTGALAADWNTTNVNPSVYLISANATIVPGDANPENNVFTDGNVTITAVTTQVAAYWILLIPIIGLGILAAIASMILIAVYHAHKRKMQSRSKRHVVIVHRHV